MEKESFKVRNVRFRFWSPHNLRDRKNNDKNCSKVISASCWKWTLSNYLLLFFLNIYLKILKPLGFCSRLHNTGSLSRLLHCWPWLLGAILSLRLWCQGDTREVMNYQEGLGSLSLVWKFFHPSPCCPFPNLTLINRQVLPLVECGLHFVVPLSWVHRLPRNIPTLSSELLASLVQVDYHLSLLAF